jgi:small ubiquitin-related modifier
MPLNKQVESSTGEEVFFKIKRNTRLSKLSGAYATKVGKDLGTFRSVFSLRFDFILPLYRFCLAFS